MREYNIADSLRTIKTLFKKNNVPWMVHAGFGLYLHGIEEADTHDIDIVTPLTNLIEIQRILSPSFKTTLREPGLSFDHGTYDSHCLRAQMKDVVIEFIQENEATVFGEHFKSIFDKKTLQKKQYKRRYGMLVPIAPLEDILLYKLILRRGPKQGKQDLFEISQTLTRNLDLQYLQTKAKKVGGNHLLEHLDRYKLLSRKTKNTKHI